MKDQSNPVQQMSPRIMRILAPNPSPMTYRGTNTYLIGGNSLAVIDPGPDDAGHLQTILSTAGDRKIEAIFVTHAHVDHSLLAPDLAARTGAPVYGFGRFDTGRAAHMDALAAAGIGADFEGIDQAFTPDLALRDGQIVTGTDWQVEAIWTPGHLSNHMCFGFENVLFTGDHVMGWASSMIAPPNGDVAAFMKSCEALRARGDLAYYPGHGDVVTDPAARLKWLIDHRKAREAEILTQLRHADQDVLTLTRAIYTDIPAPLLPAAAQNVFAHLIDLVERGQVSHEGDLRPETRFSPRK